MRPGCVHIGHTGLLNVLAKQRRASDGAVARQFVGRTLRGAAEQNWIIAVIDSLDVEHRLRARVAGIVTGPFAERPLVHALFGVHKSLEDHFGVGRDWKSGDLSGNHLQWSAAHSANEIVLAGAVWSLATGHQEGQ